MKTVNFPAVYSDSNGKCFVKGPSMAEGFSSIGKEPLKVLEFYSGIGGMVSLSLYIYCLLYTSPSPRD